MHASRALGLRFAWHYWSGSLPMTSANVAHSPANRRRIRFIRACVCVSVCACVRARARPFSSLPRVWIRRFDVGYGPWPKVQ